MSRGVATYDLFRESHPLTEPGHDLNGALGKELSTHEVGPCWEASALKISPWIHPDLDVFDRPPNVFFKEVFYQPLLCSATAFLALWRTGGTVYGRDLEEKLCACIMRCIHDTNSHHVAITGLSVVNCQFPRFYSTIHAFYLMHVGFLMSVLSKWKELQRMTVLPSTSDEPLVALLGDALRERLQWLGSFLCTSPMAAYDLKTEAQTYIEYLDMSSYLGMEGPYCHVWHVPFSLF